VSDRFTWAMAILGAIALYVFGTIVGRLT